MNLNFDASFLTFDNFVRFILVFVLVLYAIFSILVVKQVHVLTKAIQTQDGAVLNLTAFLLFVAGAVLMIWITLVAFF